MNGRRDVGVDDAELAVDAGGTALDDGQRPDQRRVNGDAGEREVLDRALGLRAPQGSRGDPDLAHRVVFDPVITVAHAPIVPHPPDRTPGRQALSHLNAGLAGWPMTPDVVATAHCTPRKGHCTRRKGQDERDGETVG